MAQVLASRSMALTSSSCSDRQASSATSSRAQPQLRLTVMRSGQSMGGQRFGQQSFSRRPRGQACRPQSFCNPGYGGGVNFAFGPSDFQDMMRDFEKWAGPNARSGAARGSESNPLSFPVDVEESTEAYTFFADLPGVQRADTKVQTNKEERSLVISGSRVPPSGSATGEDAAEAGRRRRSERRFGAFKRTFTLPEDADLKGISARFKDGVLEVTVKRTKPVEPEVSEVPIDDWIDIDTSSSSSA